MKKALTWWLICLGLAWFWVHLALFLMPTNAHGEEAERAIKYQTQWDVRAGFALDGKYFEFHDVYHEDITPFVVTGVNYGRKILYIKVDDAFTNGSDGACQAFGSLVLNILNALPDGWALYPTNKWIPSAKKLISKNWAKKLAEGY